MLSRIERTWDERLAAWVGGGPLGGVLGEQTSQGWRLRPLVRRYRWFSLLVVLPTLVTALYLYLLAADQYVSEAQFMIRSAQPPSASSALNSMFGNAVALPTAGDSSAVAAFLLSHDAVAELDRKLDLKTIYRRPLIDVFGRLNGDPKAETLLRYYQHKVKVASDDTTGVITLTVRAFRPADAQHINEGLLTLSDQLVNSFNDRAQADALRVAQAEVARSEARVASVHDQLSQFRDQRRSLDPEKSGAMVTQVIGGIEGQLATARAELAVQSAALRAGNPRLVALQSKVASLERQATAQQGRLAGAPGSLAPAANAFERLGLEREFADKEYAAAMASLESAHLDAEKKHLYLVRIVQPNLPEKSLYPQRAYILLTLFVGLLVAYGIGWLILAGIREHAA
jgi:capsular polysaccharide transport system permease protein